MNLMFKKAWMMRWALNLWPPIFFSGIKIKHLSADYRSAQATLTMRPWNTNAMGAHFGGSLYAMTDPCYMLMLMAQLGKDYVVWDKSADIDYIKPGKGLVTADFLISEALLDDIIKNTANGDKYLPQLPVYVKDAQGDVVAKVNRTLYIRRKQNRRK
ncbi:DUF4442 domain-containing protein [Thalassomonas actiniarum]|uniref:DUF4442 domain-containing protein n=1 Tax=Thalassomonas actiniarum TaxID=485447 RepID=A0AAE9YMA5_9GAMM|nr:DUF4442 domain-containing protein [Thalassomonas actiniarum]WDD97561.1 DUF4442 domain-containing protein [Thalassomonas actiniarum]